jgi:acyl-CoA dehydrogenase
MVDGLPRLTCAGKEKLAERHGAAGMGVSDLNSPDPSETVQALRKLQARAKELGLWALGHPKEVGGGGMPFADYVYINEVQGRSELAPIVLGTHSLQDSLMLLKHASTEIRNRYLPGIVSASIYPSFAMTEPDIVSSDPTGIQTSAELVNGEWRINGRKWWTSNAQNAAYTCVMVRTEPKSAPGHGAFSIILVPTSTPGYTIVRSTHVLGTHGADHSEVLYQDVRVPESNLIGVRGGGFLIAQERLGPGRIFHCMRWLGQMQRGARAPRRKTHPSPRERKQRLISCASVWSSASCAARRWATRSSCSRWCSILTATFPRTAS